jgi:hypothetical protein
MDEVIEEYGMTIHKNPLIIIVSMVLILAGATSLVAAAKDSVPTPKEYGVYAKTSKGLLRITPNIVSDERGVFYLESNNPQHFPVGSIEYFIVYGQYQFRYLTLNPLVPFETTPLGINRFMFGKEMDLVTTKKSEFLYITKPKGLFGRGYYSLWIEDTAWDFIID